MLLVVTGGARSGKSRVAHRLAEDSARPVVVAVAGHAEADEEMRRRIDQHRCDRPEGWATLEVARPSGWVSSVPGEACLLVDCLGGLVSWMVAEALVPGDDLASGEAEGRVDGEVSALVRELITREGDTVVVTNEVGDGVVPAFASGRLFRDALGRANAGLVAAADGAWLVVAGRCVALHQLPDEAAWPSGEAR